MKRLFSVVLLLVLFTSQVNGAARNNNIMIDVYNQALTENYRDTESLLGRAREYYQRNELFKALDDVSKAIKYIGGDDNELLRDGYMLKANIYKALGKYSDALSEVNGALKISSDVQALSLRANLHLNLDMNSMAKADFEALLKVNNRDYAAMFGLAKVAVIENNIGIAKEYVDKAVDLYKSNADVYLNRAEIYSQLGEYSKATHDLILAMSMDYGNSRAARLLLRMSKTNYAEVIASLDDAISHADESLALYYVRAFIKMNETDYAGALDDMEIVTTNIKDKYSDGVCADLALIYYKLGQSMDALTCADLAVRLNADNINHYILKARINLELRKYDEAENDLKLAMLIDPFNSNLLLLMSQIRMKQNDYEKAIIFLNEAVMNNPEVAENLIQRGLIKGRYLGDDKGAKDDFNMVLLMDDGSLNSYRGFALAFLDRNEEAEMWIQEQLSVADDLREANYVAATLYATLGETDKALVCIEAALANGYGDLYNLTSNEYGFMNCSMINGLPKFMDLIFKYLHILMD